MNKYLKIDYTYHNHTSRCGHALGDDEEYIIEAIKEGFTKYGFADHGMFLDMSIKQCGRDPSLFMDYINSYRYLKEKYKDKIDIYLGFEIEYSDAYIDYYKDLLYKYNFDYLICGQHSYIKNHRTHYYFNNMDNMKRINQYKDDVIKAMKSGLFTYIAHPDLFFNRITRVTDEIKAICEEIVLASIKYDVPLEINLGGLRWNNKVAINNGGLPYPNKEFFKIAKKHNAKVVIGIDSHQPLDISRMDELEFGYNFAKELGIEILKDVKFKK